MTKLVSYFFALMMASPAAIAKSVFIVNCAVTGEDATSAIEERKDDPELIGIPVTTEAEGAVVMRDILDHRDAQRMSRHGSAWATLETSTFIRAEESPLENGTQICILYEGEYAGQLELKKGL